MYIFHFGHYSFDMWAHPLTYISPHASNRSLGQRILTIFGHHAHQSWPDRLNETGQHGKIVLRPDRSDHISAEISWHVSNGHLYMSAGPLLAWKLTESCPIIYLLTGLRSMFQYIVKLRISCLDSVTLKLFSCMLWATPSFSHFCLCYITYAYLPALDFCHFMI